MLRNKSMILTIIGLNFDLFCMITYHNYLWKSNIITKNHENCWIRWAMSCVWTATESAIPRILSKRIRGYREFQLELVKTIHEREGFRDTQLLNLILTWRYMYKKSYLTARSAAAWAGMFGWGCRLPWVIFLNSLIDWQNYPKHILFEEKFRWRHLM